MITDAQPNDMPCKAIGQRVVLSNPRGASLLPDEGIFHKAFGLTSLAAGRHSHRPENWPFVGQMDPARNASACFCAYGWRGSYGSKQQASYEMNLDTENASFGKGRNGNVPRAHFTQIVSVEQLPPHLIVAYLNQSIGLR